MKKAIQAWFENKNDKQFAAFFRRHIQQSLRAAEALGNLFSSIPHLEPHFTCIVEAEEAGDLIVDQIHQLLDAIFITKKITKEDIHRLANQLDDILDDMYDSALYIHDYQLTSADEEAHLLVDVIQKMLHKLAVLVDRLLSLSTESVGGFLFEMKALEHEGDRLRSVARRKTFQESDPKLFVAWKDIDAKLEKVTDHCFYAVDIIASIVRKY